MNLSIVDYFGYNLSPQERLRLIKEAGFGGVMLLWAGYFDKDYNHCLHQNFLPITSISLKIGHSQMIPLIDVIAKSIK